MAKHDTTERIVVDPTTGGRKGQKLSRFDLIPPGAMEELAKVYGVGSLKYEDNNWMKGYSWGLSIGALERHFNRWKRGESFDPDPELKKLAPDTPLRHMAQVMWHAAALLTFELRQLGTDDRADKDLELWVPTVEAQPVGVGGVDYGSIGYGSFPSSPKEGMPINAGSD